MVRAVRLRATSVTWLFPGERVRTDVACLDCTRSPSRCWMAGSRAWIPDVVRHLNYGFGPSRGRTPYL
jgi:hypothetical protein